MFFYVNTTKFVSYNLLHVGHSINSFVPIIGLSSLASTFSSIGFASIGLLQLGFLQPLLQQLLLFQLFQAVFQLFQAMIQ